MAYLSTTLDLKKKSFKISKCDVVLDVKFGWTFRERHYRSISNSMLQICAVIADHF